MEQRQHTFEQRLKDSLEHFEVPYNSADWNQMERALSSGVRGWGRGRSILAAAAVAGALLIGGTAYFMGRDSVPPTATAEVTGVNPSAHAPAVLEQPAQTNEWPDRGDHAGEANGKHGADATAPINTTGTSGEMERRNDGPKHTKRSPHQAVSATISPDANKLEDDALFHASAKETCPGDPVDFVVEHTPEDGIYLWNFGDGSFSNKPNPVHTFTKPGRYEVMLSLSSSGAGAIHNKPGSTVIVVHEGPSADFTMAPLDAPGSIPTVRFKNGSADADSYQWNFGDGVTSTEPEPEHIFKKKGTYRIELQAISASGCVNRSIQEINVAHDHDLGAPDRFSPNGDGVDDNFMPGRLMQLRSSFEMTVFDKAGKLVYRTSDAQRPWDGTVQGSAAVCPAGSYVWVVDVKSGNKGPETFTGQVQLEH